MKLATPNHHGYQRWQVALLQPDYGAVSTSVHGGQLQRPSIHELSRDGRVQITPVIQGLNEADRMPADSFLATIRSRCHNSRWHARSRFASSGLSRCPTKRRCNTKKTRCWSSEGHRALRRSPED